MIILGFLVQFLEKEFSTDDIINKHKNRKKTFVIDSERASILIFERF